MTDEIRKDISVRNIDIALWNEAVKLCEAHGWKASYAFNQGMKLFINWFKRDYARRKAIFDHLHPDLIGRTEPLTRQEYLKHYHRELRYCEKNNLNVDDSLFMELRLTGKRRGRPRKTKK